MPHEAGPGAPDQGRSANSHLRLALFAGGLFLLYLAVFHIWPLVSPSETAVLNTGQLKKLYMAEGILVRDETVVTSPAGGQLYMIVQEGERVRPGDSLAEIKMLSGDSGASARSALIRAPRSGVVIRGTDGLEGVLNPGQLDILEVAGRHLKAGEIAGREELKNDRFDKGQPVMKIVDNLAPLAICLQVPEGFPPDMAEKGDDVSLIWENQELTGRVTSAGVYDGHSRLVIQAMNYPGGLIRKRKVVVSMVGDTVSGLLVHVKSLAPKDGQQGLYIASKNEIKWVPVTVEGIVGDRAAVSGRQISPGTRYVVSPHGLLTYR